MNDGFASEADRISLVSRPEPNGFFSYVGDSNLDGEFNSADLVNVFMGGEFEDAAMENSVWATGDWNGDQEFDTSDLILALARGNYEGGSRPMAADLPEPIHGQIGVILGFAIILKRRTDQRGE